MASEAQKKYWESLKGKKGKNAPNWKGDKVSKSGIHLWLNKNYGKPKECEHCGEKDIKCDWANTNNHKYRRRRKDFIRLCVSCHRKYDMTEKKKKKAVKNLTWYDRRNHWSVKHDKCVKCGTTEIRHKCQGYCDRCYRKFILKRNYGKRKMD